MTAPNINQPDKSFPVWQVDPRPVLITGGAGFIGCNVADALLSMGQSVIVYDNLSRGGVEQNLDWLHGRHGGLLETAVADVRDRRTLNANVARASRVFHFAAQVAVTSSIADPQEDFEINAIGSFNLLEAIRAQPCPPPLLFTSTNKVYGALDDLKLHGRKSFYEPEDKQTLKYGISEERSLDFHSPYGCSKGTADQYVLDSSRTHGLKTVVFRMSCIYGPRQFGTEDQGWVAHFLIQALKDRPIKVYGDGRQVRDILFVDDLVRAMLLAQLNIESLSGSAFNIGGGVNNSVSLLKVLEIIKSHTGDHIPVSFDEWRLGDQRYYVSDTRKFQNATGWSPSVSANDGIGRLYRWLLEFDYSADLQIMPPVAAGVA